MIKITHIITALNVGGAEEMLYKLLSRADKSLFQTEIISLTNIGPAGEKIKTLGVPVRAVGMPNPIGFVRLIRFLREQKPDIVQTWMHHSDIIGGIASKIAHRRVPVVWNVRYGNTSLFRNKFTRTLAIRFASVLSNFLPAKIIYCANSARVAHERIGYARRKSVYIPNGFDLEKFCPDSEARASLRHELGISEETFLIGMIARFDPLKNHRLFCAAAKIVASKHPETHFLLCGRGVDKKNKNLMQWIKESGAEDRFHLLGERDNVPKVMAALDVSTLVSSSEGFPNVVGEAMACGVPCVVTVAGDSAEIVGDAGIVVKSASAEKVVEGWLKILKMPQKERITLGERARERIKAEFFIDNIAQHYYNLYQQLCSER